MEAFEQLRTCRPTFIFMGVGVGVCAVPSPFQEFDLRRSNFERGLNISKAFNANQTDFWVRKGGGGEGRLGAMQGKFMQNPGGLRSPVATNEAWTLVVVTSGREALTTPTRTWINTLTRPHGCLPLGS